MAAASSLHGLGGGSLTMGGRQREISMYGRYNRTAVDGVRCQRSDGVTMMVSDGGDMFTCGSSGPDHIEPTLWPCYGKNGEAGRGRAARRCASVRDPEIRITLLYPV